MKLFKLKIISLFIFSFYVCSTSRANEKTVAFDSANASYAAGNYKKAIEQYENLVHDNLTSAELYFNLGNAYYKSDNIGLAILNYERAKKIDPSDEDLITNLKLANQKTEDKIDATPQLFLTKWKNGILGVFNERDWSILCILLFSVSMFLFGLFILSSNNGLKKMGFFTGCILFILTIITFFIAQHKYELTVKSSDAIIISSTATVTGSPNDKGTKLFILHEGTKVMVTQEQNEWTEIKIANGNVGWIKTDFLQKI